MIQTPRLPPPMLSSPHLMGDTGRPLGLGWELKTIVLEEVAAPPPRNASSILPSSSRGYESSYFTSSSSESSSVEDEESLDDEADPDSASYCSSDEDDTLPDYSTDVAARRVLAWRTGFYQQIRAESHQPRPLPASLPRTTSSAPCSYDHGSSSAASPSQPGITALACPLAMAYCCTACEASFATSHLYRDHGERADAPEACRAAVAYGLEH